MLPFKNDSKCKTFYVKMRLADIEMNLRCRTHFRVHGIARDLVSTQRQKATGSRGMETSGQWSNSRYKAFAIVRLALGTLSTDDEWDDDDK